MVKVFMLYSDDKNWIKKTLIKEDIIENKKCAKHMFTHCDLTNIIDPGHSTRPNPQK